MIEAAIKDMLDKLERGDELLQTGAIAMTVLPTAAAANTGLRSASEPAQVP